MKTNLLILIAVTLLSCNPYKKIATDVNRSEKNTKLLSQICETAFPSQKSDFKPGKVVTKTDTIKEADSIEIKRLLNLVLQAQNKDLNIDSLYNVFKATMKPIKVIIDNSKVDTVFVPEDKYIIHNLKVKIEALEKQHNEDLIKIAVLENDNEKLRQQNRKNQFTKFSGWGLIVLILGIYAVIKFKFI